MKRPLFHARAASIVLFALVGAACDPPAPPTAPPPPTVTVDVPIQREIVEWDEYTGRTEAVDSVEVRAPRSKS